MIGLWAASVGTRSISFAWDRFWRGSFKTRSRNLLCIFCLKNGKWLLSTNGLQNNAKKMQWPVEPIGILALHNVLPEERRKPTWWASVPATCGASSVSIDSPYRCFWGSYAKFVVSAAVRQEHPIITRHKAHVCEVSQTLLAHTYCA